MNANANVNVYVVVDGGDDGRAALPAAPEAAERAGPLGEIVEGGPFEGIGLSAQKVVEACHRLPAVVSSASKSEGECERQSARVPE